MLYILIPDYSLHNIFCLFLSVYSTMSGKLLQQLSLSSVTSAKPVHIWCMLGNVPQLGIWSQDGIWLLQVRSHASLITVIYKTPSIHVGMTPTLKTGSNIPCESIKTLHFDNGPLFLCGTEKSIAFDIYRKMNNFSCFSWYIICWENCHGWLPKPQSRKLCQYTFAPNIGLDQSRAHYMINASLPL